MAPSLLEIAEAPARYVIPPHPAVVERDGFVFLPLGPGTGAVQRVRLAQDELAGAQAEVRALGVERNLERVGWWECELTQPRDLGDRLGLEPSERLAALALTSEPDGDAGVEVREVATLDDYAAAQDIDSSVNGWPLSGPEQHAAMWETARTRFLVWLALADGQPVGMGRCAVSEHALMMIGGAVLPEARGRGVYRSLVAARWRSAVARGVPALVTSANEQSAPILRRLGFEELGEIVVYEDRL